MFTFNTKLNHRNKLAAARGLARKRLPYFSAALFALMPKAMPGMFKQVGAGMGVTARGVLYYDPDVVENEWDLEDVEFGLLHEVGHFLRDHAKRREQGAFHPQMWNLAGDAAINDDLVAAGCKALHSDTMPRMIKHPKTGKPMPDGLTEEAYYDAIRQMARKGQQPGQGSSQEQGGKGKGKKGSGCPRPGNGNCGGIAGNPNGLPDDGPPSQVTKGRSDVEIERVKKAVANAVKEHAEKHGAGSVPGGWKVWADQELKPPKVRWQDKIRRAVRSGVAKVKGMVNYHYARPARRQSAIGYGAGRPILPAMYAPLPRVGCFVDTSGSMGRQDLELAMPEVEGVLKSAGAEVLFGVCDAQLHGKIEKVSSIKEAIAKLVGGGGTNFNPVFEELLAMPRERRPHVVIFATDGDGPAPSQAPDGMHVIWVLVGFHARVPYDETGREVTWGEKIFVTEEGAQEAA